MGKNSGFTLLELMMTLAIAVIMLTMAIPSYVSFTKNTKVTTQVNTMVSAINLARGEAAKRGMRVVMCRSVTPTSATPTCGGTNWDWSIGWLVYAVSDNRATPLYNTGSGDVLIAAFGGIDGLDVKTAGGANKNVEFSADGTLNEGGNTAIFAFCDDRGVSHGRTLSVLPTGRPSVADATDCTP